MGRRAAKRRAKAKAKVILPAGAHPRTKASAADFYHSVRREKEEAKKEHPVTITYGCTCPRNCQLHPVAT